MDEDTKSNNNSSKFTDLTGLTDIDSEVYICDNEEPGDNIRLVPYHDIKGERLTRGKLWQCPKCGIIKDTEMDNLQRPEIIINKARENRFLFENLGMPQLYQAPYEPYNIEPADDQAIEAMGGQIKHTHIEIGGKVIR